LKTHKQDIPDDPPVPLPAAITALRIQKNNPDRVSVFVEEQFLIGISQKSVLEYHLKKGKSIGPGLYDKLLRADFLSKVEAYFLRLLGRRMYSSTELLQKARNKGFESSIATTVIQDFEEKGWIDDYKYAFAFTRDKYKLNKWGPYKIRSALRTKGIPPKLIDKAINSIFVEIDSKDALEQLVIKGKKRFLREENALKRRKKIFDHLLRKGFPSEIIIKHIDYLMGIIER